MFRMCFLATVALGGETVVAARFQSMGLYDAALNAFTLVQNEAPESVLVKHPLSALRARGGEAKGDWSDSVGNPPTREWVEAVFDGFASGYEGAMSRLAYESPRLVADAVKHAVEGRRGAVLSRAIDLGCGTGLLGGLLRGSIEGGGLIGVDVSERMLKVAEGTGAYHSLRKDDMVDSLLRGDESQKIKESLHGFSYFSSTNRQNHQTLDEIFRAVTEHAVNPNTPNPFF